jgi:NitT/TauT family transport system permease protein
VRRLDLLAAFAMMAGSLALPLAAEQWVDERAALLCAIVAIVGTALQIARTGHSQMLDRGAALLTLIAGAAAPLLVLDRQPAIGPTGTGLWLFLAGLVALLWSVLDREARGAASWPAALLAPALFGAALLYLWQVLVVGFGVPPILLPAPSQIGHVLTTRLDVLWPDFLQTAKSVLSGYALGCGAGFVTALLIDRVPFLQRGLLPLSGLVSAVPVVGIAPIMVMWFGFDWQSKAAVIVVMTFFPMLVNTRAGLAATDTMQRDLMHSYAASYWATLLKLRLPAALPFVFNALKINSTLALIGAIVAEFFGSPILGLGFRISAEIGRLNVDVVWAVIAIAALAGSLFYGAIAALERVFTFWHPSFRA